MLTPEETRVLEYLCRHFPATAAEIGRECLPGVKPQWAARMIFNLEWLGYVVVFHHAGEQLQITDKGQAYLGTRRRTAHV